VMLKDFKGAGPGNTQKHKKRWCGIWRVRKVDDTHVWVTRREDPNMTPRTFHLNQVKPFYCEEERNGPPENEEGWEIEAEGKAANAKTKRAERIREKKQERLAIREETVDRSLDELDEDERKDRAGLQTKIRLKGGKRVSRPEKRKNRHGMELRKRMKVNYRE
jgi:hypothetical protein